MVESSWIPTLADAAGYIAHTFSTGSGERGDSPPITNAMTIDVEDYFHVSAFADRISSRDWADLPSRVEQNTRRLLTLLAKAEVRATFFVLGWVAERHPQLIRDIARAGHEIGCHSYWHRLVYDLTPKQFRDDTRHAQQLLEEITGDRVTLYRAPSFSITERSLWALDILAELGFEMDSSIYPIRHDRYGIPGADPFPRGLLPASEGREARRRFNRDRSALHSQLSTQSCVFVGALDYKPNIDGAIWFCRHVWPRIREHKPHEVIRLVGREPTSEVRALAQIPGVEVIGTVPDVRPYLANAAVVVVPLQIARGVQNKVLEAMAMGKAIVASPEPIVGLQVEPGIHLLRANNVDEWVSHVTELLENRSLCEELGIAALAYVTAYHRWEQCLESLPRLLCRMGTLARPNEPQTGKSARPTTEVAR